MAQVASYLLMESEGFQHQQQNMRGVGWDYGGKSMTQCCYDFYIIYCPHLILPFKTSCIKLFFFLIVWVEKEQGSGSDLFIYLCCANVLNMCEESWWWRLSFVVERDEKYSCFFFFPLWVVQAGMQSGAILSL